MTDSWRQDAPFLAVAALLHVLVLAGNPGLPWSPAKPPERTIPVEFVSLPSAALQLPPPGDGSAKAPGHGAGEVQREMRGPAPQPAKPGRARAAKAAAKPATRRPAADPAAAERRQALQRRAMSLALARAAQAEAAAKAQAARAEAAQAAAAAKAQAQRLAEEARREAAERKAREEAERRMARARKQADIARALAVLPAPDERLAEAPAGGAGGRAAGRAAEAQALLASEAAAPELGDGGPAYAEDAARRTGKDAYSAPASGGGLGQGGGDASFTLEGPVGSRRLLSRVLPESPAWVAQRALDLAVQIRFQVLADGSVKPGAVIAKTSGFPDLDRRALEAIRKWRFAAQPDAAPVWGMVSFRFTY